MGVHTFAAARQPSGELAPREQERVGAKILIGAAAYIAAAAVTTVGLSRCASAMHTHGRRGAPRRISLREAVTRTGRVSS